MNDITTGLQVAAEELKQLKTDIDILDKESMALKPTVDQFENKRKEIKALRKTYNEKKKRHDIVLSFFTERVDEHYLDNVFPLFKDHQNENTRTWIDENEVSNIPEAVSKEEAAS